MKKITIPFIIVMAIMAFNIQMFAQKTVVSEVTENIGGATNPAFTVFIENADYKTVLKDWKALFEDHKGKIETSKKDVTISNAEFPLLSSTPVAIFSRVIDGKTGVKIIAAFNKEGQYVCTKLLPSETQVVNKIIYDFAVGIKKDMIQEQLDDASKELEKLQNNDQDLVKKEENLHKDIKSYADKKKKTQEKMEEITKQLSNMIEKDPKLLDKKAGYEKDIVEFDEKTRKAENDIQENSKQQSESKIKIENQTKIVEDLRTKLTLVD